LKHHGSHHLTHTIRSEDRRRFVTTLDEPMELALPEFTIFRPQ
jgi:hypothetical protein